MLAKYAEEYYLYWFEVNKFQEQINYMDNNTKKEKALHIFNIYVENESPSFVKMDSATRAQIKEDLAINSKGALCQKHMITIDKAFEVSHMKVYHKLKFEYMPQFLVSEQFAAVEAKQENTIFDGDDDLNQSCNALTEDMTVEYILENPHGVHRMKEFVFSGGGR
jgi:hypothetical protein